MYTLLVIFSLFFSGLQLVRGHGYVTEVTVGGKTYPAWRPFDDPYLTPPPTLVARKVASSGPVNPTSPEIDCGLTGDTGTAATATAAAGSQVKFQWTPWLAEHRGPVSIFMANCNGNCATFSANAAQWFKIDYQGYDPATEQWAADKLIAAGSIWTGTIPAGLAPGKYLMRHEIIALHSTPAQYYPMCLQLDVTGGGSGVPGANELVKLQEMYSATTFPYIWGPADKISFNIPGPAPVSFSGDAPAPVPSPTSSTTPALPTATPAPPAYGPSPPASSSSSVAPLPTGAPAPPPRQCGLNRRSRLKHRSF